MMDANPPAKQILLSTLEVAVPIAIQEVRDWSWEQRSEAANHVSKLIVEKGDILQFGGGKKGEVAQVFSALAKGLAVLSFAPGGVWFCGLHWETKELAE